MEINSTPAAVALPLNEPTYEVGARKLLITLTVITCAIMELIDTSIVNVAIRQIAGTLGATIEETAWVITSYAVSNIIIYSADWFSVRYFWPESLFHGIGRAVHHRVVFVRLGAEH